jgi:hypothetical protein
MAFMLVNRERTRPLILAFILARRWPGSQPGVPAVSYVALVDMES